MRHANFPELAERTSSHQVTDDSVHPQRQRRRHDLRDELRVLARLREHRLRLRDVGRHARLREDVLARLERRQRDLGVQVGPGADAHRIDVRRSHDLTPIRRHAGDPMTARNPLRGLPGTIGHNGEFDIRERPKARDVPSPGIVAGTDETDTQARFRHHASQNAQATDG
jgi:hypothetical protein